MVEGCFVSRTKFGHNNMTLRFMTGFFRGEYNSKKIQ